MTTPLAPLVFALADINPPQTAFLTSNQTVNSLSFFIFVCVYQPEGADITIIDPLSAASAYDIIFNNDVSLSFLYSYKMFCGCR